MNLIILFEEDFIEENKVRLQGRRLKHVQSIHKADIGDTLRVGLLNGKMGEGKIISLTKESIEMNVNLIDNPSEPSNIKLILAMPRPKVFKRILQDVTTMGIKDIYLIKTWRVDKSYWGSSLLSDDNLLKHMILGLEQGKDTILPRIHIKKLFKPFVEDEIPNIIKGTRPIAGHPTGERECPRGIYEPVTLAIGPEGGFIPYEVEMLKKQGFEIVSLGKRILRVETAVPYLIGRLS
ncbi:MAG: 16S rRNA (uracil(1498)-N(3))-methyltransferase [Firmicutes bacterium]|nr:16S rRNA (uracil(1498)-N(3))-methyltransferase [Bacillota bacterium]